jgi:SH3 domain protein
MKNVIALLISSLLGFSLPSLAQEEQTLQQSAGYIADDLIIYMHAGPGTNFRILGSIVAGTLVSITGLEENNYSQIIDDKERTTWVESQYVSTKPGLRFVIAELNEQLASTSGQSTALDDQLADALAQNTELNAANDKLKQEITSLNSELASTTGQLKNQDMKLKTEWFFNGAIVLILGLILGLLVPRLSGKRRQNMDNWK